MASVDAGAGKQKKSPQKLESRRRREEKRSAPLGGKGTGLFQEGKKTTDWSVRGTRPRGRLYQIYPKQKQRRRSANSRGDTNGKGGGGAVGEKVVSWSKPEARATKKLRVARADQGKKNKVSEVTKGGREETYGKPVQKKTGALTTKKNPAASVPRLVKRERDEKKDQERKHWRGGKKNGRGQHPSII